MIDTEEIIDEIFYSTAGAFTDGYSTKKILLTQQVYDAFKKENEEVLGKFDADFNTLLGHPIEINNEIESYMVVLEEWKSL